MARTAAQPGVDRRQRILEAALDAFAEHGFEGATTTRIAARAGATQGLIYFYFPKGKEELFAAAFEHQADQTFGALALDPLFASASPPEITLRLVIERFIRVMGSARCLSMTRVLWRTMANAGGGDDRLSAARQCGMAHIQRLIAQLGAYLEAQAARGALRVGDAQVTARLIVGGMLMLLRMAGTVEGEEAIEARAAALADQIASVYIHGLLPAVG